jgi:two-component system OmpR family sensor kinase
LGLAIAKRTVEAHGGVIAAAAAAEGGLMLRIDLPLARPQNSEPGTQDHSS